MPTRDEIRVLLRQLDGNPAEYIESETLECKSWDNDARALARMLCVNAVCLANQRGGTIVLGVRDDARTRRDALQGVGRYDLNAIRRSIYEGTDPHILAEVEELVEPEATLLLVHIPRGLPPHTTTDGLAKIRIGTECKPLTGPMLGRLLAAGGQRDPTAEFVAGATLADVDRTELERLRGILRTEGRFPRAADQTDEALLESLQLGGSGGVTLAGLLLVGTEGVLARLVPQHEVVFLRYRSATRYDQRRDLRGPLLRVLQEIEQLVSANNRIRTIQEEGLGQLEFPDLSWEVARESVLNAVTHRDYFIRQGIQLSLYRDRLEVVSPGGFIGGITPENVLRHPPVHRNELLARAFQTMGLANRVGLGVDRIFHELLRLGKDVPVYVGDEAHIRLSLPLETDDAFARFVAREERSGRPLELDDLLVLKTLARRESLNRWEAARVLQSTEEEASRRLSNLRERGFCIARGRGRGAAYGLRRDLAVRLRGEAAANADVQLDREGVRLRILALLGERGRLTNAEIRRFSGFSRTEVYSLVRTLVDAGQARFVGRGRGAHLEPGPST